MMGVVMLPVLLTMMMVMITYDEGRAMMLMMMMIMTLMTIM